MFIVLVMVVVSQVYSYVQTHQIVYTKYVKCLYLHYISIKWQKREKMNGDLWLRKGS